MLERDFLFVLAEDTRLRPDPFRVGVRFGMYPETLPV